METLDLIGTIFGFVYLWLEYKASIYLWIVGIVMPAIYLFVYYKAGLYADFGINIYYLFAAVYGWIVWTYGKKRGQTDEEELPVSRVKLRYVFPCVFIFIALFFVIAWILIHFTNSNVPWLDSFTTSLSIIGMWLLARKYVEQWLVWIAVDAVSCGLYIYKNLPFTAFLYGSYAVIAIFGFYKWKKMMNHEKPSVTQ